MLFSKFKAKQDRYILENMTFRIVTIALVALLAYQGFYIANKANSERVVFVPPAVMSQEFSISGNTVSKSYLEQVGQYIAYNLYNATPSNFISNAENILALVESNNYHETKLALTKQQEYLYNNDISRTLFINSITSNTANIVVRGIVKDSVGDKIINTITQDLTISYTVKNGRFYITALSVKDSKK